MSFKHYLFLFLFFCQLGFCQLSDFTLQVTATNETCLGNGALQFSVSNTQPNALIEYTVFLLPNQTTPIVITANNQLTGLNSGNYLVIATQSLDGSSGTKQQQVSILNNITPLTFTISQQAVRCGNDGVLTANVNSGMAVSYELLTGPVTRPLQTSNIFSNLPAGNYTIRVYDNCGNAVVNSITLIQSYTAVAISFAQVKEGSLTCDTVTLRVSANFSDPNIVYPLMVEFSVYPPNGAPVLVYTQTVLQNNGNLEQIIPRFDGDHYFNVKITDGCGNVVSDNDNSINNDLFLNLQSFSGCELELRLNITRAVYPYTLEFIAAPAGFDPSLTYSYHPGPYFIESPIFSNVPPGIYTVKVTDACNKTITATGTVQNSEVLVAGGATNDGCGSVKVSINNSGVSLQTVILVAAPAVFQGTLPFDMSGLIVNLYNGTQVTSSSVNYTGLPQGSYVFQMTDSCGNSHDLTIVVPVAVRGTFSVSQYPACIIGFGTVKTNYSGNINYYIQSAIITTAPSGFPHTLPYTITDILGTGFLLAGVPQGSYTVEMTSVCGNVQTDIFVVEGYNELNTTLEVQQFCSTFNFKFTHQGNGNNPLYALQIFDTATGNWVHPVTGLQIINNQITTNNFYQIEENQFNVNLPFTGRFRIIKAVETDGFGSLRCIRGIKEFEISLNPKIAGYDVISCTSGLSTVVINATGIGQLLYRITQKNGQPFLVNNGNSNVFINLSPAIYDFQVEDACGNIINRQIQIFQSLPLSITSNLCENQPSSLSVSNYSFLSYQWWKDGAPGIILSTTNVLTFNPFISATHNGIYHVSIIHVGNPGSCLNTDIAFTVSDDLGSPSAGNDYTASYCTNPGMINLNDHLSGSFSTDGHWIPVTSNGDPFNGVVDVSDLDYGTYVYHYVVNGLCSQTDIAVFTITLTESPTQPDALPDYFLCEGGALTIDPGFQNNADYLWSGPNGFNSNNQILEIADITSNSIGNYTLEIKKGDCSVGLSFQIDVSSFPDFEIDEFCIDNKKTLHVVSADSAFNEEDFTYQWTGPDNYTNDQPLIYINEEELGVYTVVVSNSLGCTQSAEIKVESLTCKIPKGLSPNGDGDNDSFDLSGFDIKELKIFNRYGTEVYSQENYKKEWHGQCYNGNILPSGTYYYVLKLTNGESKTGWVYLVA